MPPTDKRCAFLTMDDTGGWSIDADLAFEPMAALGWQCEWLPWRRKNVTWSDYTAVYMAAPWDYPRDPDAFLRVLGEIDASAAVLVNDLSLVRWNLAKTYLRDLAASGASIVPSRWSDELREDFLEHGGLDEIFAVHGERIIIKPVINTNATDTFLLSRPIDAGKQKQLQQTFYGRAWVVQPFIENIRSEGEFSLFHFGARYSHAIRKIPRSGDFRVQEEHGAEITTIEPDAVLRQVADEVVSLVHPAPVYCRSDFVRGDDGRYLLMELELIEPSMYLRMHSEAPVRFARAFDAYVTRIRGQ